MKKINYDGVLIELPSERPMFSHSISMMIVSKGKIESNHNIPYFERLMQYKETDLPEGELLHEVCALNSIRNLNYQVNNGGFSQYFFNEYHKYRAGYQIGDLSNLDIAQQIEFLEKLISFIVFDVDKKPYEADLLRALILLKEQQKNILEYENWCDEEDEIIETELAGCSVFDTQWYKVNEVIEWGIELYAQYLCKRLEAMNIEPSDK